MMVSAAKVVDLQSGHALKLEATNERQDNGAGILHQVAQFPIDQWFSNFLVSLPLGNAMIGHHYPLSHSPSVM